MQLRALLASTAAGAALITTAVIAPASTASADPCAFTVKSNKIHYEGAGLHYTVTFGNTCGRYARAYYHENDFPTGTHYLYGNTVYQKGSGAVSDVFITKDNYCSYGYQVKTSKNGKWKTYNLSGNSC